MVSLTKHEPSKVTKLLLIGESGSGKTGALASLAAAGYNLRILDMDNGIDILKDLLSGKDPKYPKDAMARVDVRTITETMKSMGGKVFPAKASAWPKAMSSLESWKDEENDFGRITTWGPQDVLVIDSLSMLSNAAYNFILAMNGKLMSGVTGYEYQRTIGQAQVLIEDFIRMLYDAEVKCNVIVNSHITYMDEPGLVRTSQEERLPQQGFATALGKAVVPRIPRFFNSVLMAKKVGLQHKIYTKISLNVNLKTSAPLKVAPEYPLSTGLADYFKVMREE